MLVLDTTRKAFHAAKKHRDTVIEKTRAATKQARDREEAAFAPDGDMPTNTLESCIGKPMAHSEVMKRIHKLNSNLVCMYANANPNGIGVYVRDSHANRDNAKYSGIRYTGISFEKGYLPEFDVHHTVEKEYWDEATQTAKTQPILDPNRPLTRGWWTLVMRLIRSNYIERVAGLAAFGRGPSRSSKKWRDTMV